MCVICFDTVETMLGTLFPRDRLLSHLNEVFMTGLDFGKAAARFREIVKRAPSSIRTRFKNALHAAAQKGKQQHTQEIVRWSSMLRPNVD